MCLRSELFISSLFLVTRSVRTFKLLIKKITTDICKRTEKSKNDSKKNVFDLLTIIRLRGLLCISLPASATALCFGRDGRAFEYKCTAPIWNLLPLRERFKKYSHCSPSSGQNNNNDNIMEYDKITMGCPNVGPNVSIFYSFVNCLKKLPEICALHI